MLFPEVQITGDILYDHAVRTTGQVETLPELLSNKLNVDLSYERVSDPGERGAERPDQKDLRLGRYPDRTYHHDPASTA